MSNRESTVQLVIKARDESQRVLNNATTALDRFTAAQARTAARRSALSTAQADGRRAYDAYTEAAAAAEALGRKLANTRRPSAALRAEFDAARASARQMKMEFGQAGTALLQLQGKAGAGRGSFAAFDAIASGAARAESAIEAETAALNRNTGALRNNAKAGDLASRTAGAFATRQGRGPLGLRPYEMQNLGYQVNDVITQLGSGTPAMQVLAQQGGQFIQIFPKAGAALLRFLPIIGLVTIALSPFIAALSKANGQAASMSEFDKLLTRSGEGASYTADQLTRVAAALDDYGTSLKDARAALTEFVGDSVAPEYLERFGKTAVDTSKVLGIDVTEAAKKVSDAFTGNADAVLSLDDELNFLTDTERKHIEKLRESRRDADARTEAFAIFERRYGETADKMRGPWSSILNNFSSAWDSFGEIVNGIDFSEIGGKIDWLMGRIADLMASLPGARSANVENAEAWVDRAMAARNRAATDLADRRSRFGANDGRTRAAQREYDFQVAETNRAQTALTMAEFRDGTNPLQQRTVTAPRDTTLDPPKPTNSGGGRDRVTDAERLAKAQQEFVAGLLAENAAREFQMSLVGQQDRAQRIAEAIREAEIKAESVKLTLTQAQREEITRTVGALYDAEVLERARATIAADALRLAEQRGEVETRAAYVTRMLTSEQLDLQSEIGRQRAEQLGLMWDQEEQTRRQEAAEKAVNDLLAQRSELTNQIQLYLDAGDATNASRLQTLLDDVNVRLTAAVDNAIAFWTSMGGPESVVALTKLGLVRDQLNGLASETVVTGREMTDLLSGALSGGFNDFAQRIGEGQNALEAFGDSFAQMAANFLLKIGEMIAQAAILQALTGSPTGVNSAAGNAGAGWINSLFSGGGGGGGNPLSFLTALFRHDGGMVGRPGSGVMGFRNVAAMSFANAQRYHGGGIAGLKSGEVPAVLMEGEEVLTEEDYRHQKNLGKGAGRERGVKIVNVLDPVDMLSKALSSDAGERVFFNFARKNQQLFGGKG